MRDSRVAALSVLAAVLLATTATFLVLWLVDRGEGGEPRQHAGPPGQSSQPATPPPADPAAVKEAGRRLATLVTTYDHRTIQEDIAEVLDNSTGEFRDQYQGASSALSDLMKETKAVAKGTVLEIAVAESEPGRAKLLVFVDQEVRNNDRPKPKIDRTRVVLTLVEQDGRWLIEALELK